MSKKDPLERGGAWELTGGGLGLKELSRRHDFSVSRSSWIKKSTLLFNPKRNARRSAGFFSPLITSKFSLYQIFRPNEREPYLKARAAFIDGSDCLNLGCFFKFVNNIRSCSASEMFLLNNSEVIMSGGLELISKIGLKRLSDSPPGRS